MQRDGARFRIFLIAGGLVLALGLWLQWGLSEPPGAKEDQYKKQDLAAGQLRDRLKASQARENVQERPIESEPVAVKPTPEEELDQLTEDFPLELDSLPPEVLEEIAAISKDDPEGGISPEQYEELAEQMRAAGFAGSQVGRLALHTMVDTQIAWERYQRQDQIIELPPQEELNLMKAKMDAWEPSPRQWELLRGTTREPEVGGDAE